MARYQLIIAYDGTHFQGFQRQGRVRSVQGEFEKALKRLNWQGQSILAAGRTDSGTHASGQVVAFDLDWEHPIDDLPKALNAYLPADVAVRSALETSPCFHPRFDAESRRYLYRIFCAPERTPLFERYAWRVWPEVDFDLMCLATPLLLGTHDFVAFGAASKPGRSTTRCVYRAGWEVRQEVLQFEIEANAFLYHMVRRLVYLLVQVGQKRLELEELAIGVTRARPQPPGLAPAHGLFLTEVKYAPLGISDLNQSGDPLPG